MRRIVSTVIGFGIIGAFFAPTGGAQTFVIGGPAASFTPSSGSWSWDGGVNVQPFRTALENPSHFGPSAPVPTSIVTQNLTTIDATTLAGVDAFIATWWSDNDTPLQAANDVVSWFLAGGHLILYQDHYNYDKIGELLGIPTSLASDGSFSNGTEPFFDGPFGTAANISQWGTIGQINTADVAAHHGTVGATNASGQVTAAFWHAGEYAPGAGRLLIFGDVDMMSSMTSTFAPLNDNGTVALNAAALLTGVGSNIRYYGQGCAGSGGFLPTIAVLGDATPLTSFGFQLINALGGTQSMLLFGAMEASIPIGFSSCSILVAPIAPFAPIVPVGGSGAGNGTFILAGVIPPSSAGLSFVAQVLIADSQTITGFSSTGGVEVTVPEL